MKFQIILYFGIFALSRCEEQSQFSFRCFDKQCSRPIQVMKARANYNPDHVLKMPVRKDDEIPIFGISDETEVFLVKRNDGKEFFVPANFLVNLRQEKLHPASEMVIRTLPISFANRNHKLPPKDLGPIEKPKSNVFKSNVKLRIFLQTVLHHSMNFIESKASLESAGVTHTPRVIHGESPYGKTPYIDNSTEEVPVPDGSDSSTIKDEEVVEFYDNLNEWNKGMQQPENVNLNVDSRMPDTVIEPNSGSNGAILNESPPVSSLPETMSTQNMNFGDSQNMNVGDTQNMNFGDPQNINVGDSHNVNFGDSQNMNVGDSHNINGNSQNMNVGDPHNMNFGNSQNMNVGDPHNMNFGGHEKQGNPPTVKTDFVETKPEPAMTVSEMNETVDPANLLASTNESMNSKSPSQPEFVDSTTTPSQTNHVGETSMNPSVTGPANGNEVPLLAKVDQVNVPSIETPPIDSINEFISPQGTMEPNINFVNEKPIPPVSDVNIDPTATSIRTNTDHMTDFVPTSSETHIVNEMNPIPSRPINVDEKFVPADFGHTIDSTEKIPQANIANDVNMKFPPLNTNINQEAGSVISTQSTYEESVVHSEIENTSQANIANDINMNSPPLDTNINQEASHVVSTQSMQRESVVFNETENIPQANIAHDANMNLPSLNADINQETGHVVSTQSTHRESVVQNEIKKTEVEGLEQESTLVQADPKTEVVLTEDDRKNLQPSAAENLNSESETATQTSGSMLYVDDNTSHRNDYPHDVPFLPIGSQTPLYSSNLDQKPLNVETNTDSITYPKADLAEEKDTTEETTLEENSFFTSFVEYFSTIPIDISNFSVWFSKKETSNEFCSSGEGCDGIVLNLMEGVHINLDSHAIQIPFWVNTIEVLELLRAEGMLVTTEEIECK